MKRLIITALIALNIQGCSLFTKPLEQPVIKDRLNVRWLSEATVGTLSLTPERRVVLVNFRNKRFCAEAPTEIGVDLASAISANISGGQTDKATIAAAVKSALSSQNSVLNKRTQGMQLFLANSYFTCQMFMNGGIDERQLLEMQIQTLEIIKPLISTEIKLMYQNNVKKDEISSAQSTSKSSEEIKKDVSDTVTEILKQKSAKPDEASTPEKIK